MSVQPTKMYTQKARANEGRCLGIAGGWCLESLKFSHWLSEYVNIPYPVGMYSDVWCIFSVCHIYHNLPILFTQIVDESMVVEMVPLKGGIGG